VAVGERIPKTIRFTTRGQVIRDHHDIVVGFAMLQQGAIERL
jgi:hypothetical protein